MCNRMLIRYVANFVAGTRLLLVLLCQFALGCALFLAPAIAWLLLQPNQPDRGSALALLPLVAAFNVFTLCSSLILSLTTLLLFLDRLVWPLLGRIVYPIQRFQVIQNTKLLAATGAGCLLYAVNGGEISLKSILGHLAN